MVAEYNKQVGMVTLHPLVSVVDFEKAELFCFLERSWVSIQYF